MVYNHSVRWIAIEMYGILGLAPYTTPVLRVWVPKDAKSSGLWFHNLGEISKVPSVCIMNL